MPAFTWLPANRAAVEDVEAVFATGGARLVETGANDDYYLYPAPALGDDVSFEIPADADPGRYSVCASTSAAPQVEACGPVEVD